MRGLYPHSEEFMFLDPEHIDDYNGWQQGTEYLVEVEHAKDKITPVDSSLVSDLIANIKK